MNRRRGGLGRGLDAFLPTDTQQSVRDVPVTAISQNPRQPRTYFEPDALEELAASIREHGVIQPLIVTAAGEGAYELIAGERRWRAAQQAGLARVPVLVRETTPQQLLELALIENVQRADLSAIEEALAYQSLKDDFALSDEQIAQRVGKKSREAVANTRRLLQLPASAQEAVLQRRISAGHGRTLLKFKTPEQQQAALAVTLERDLSVRDLERLADIAGQHGGDIVTAAQALRGGATAGAAPATQQRRPTPATPRSASTDDSEDTAVQREMEQLLGTPVKIARNNSEVRVTITFYGDEMLQAFYDMLNRQ